MEFNFNGKTGKMTVYGSTKECNGQNFHLIDKKEIKEIEIQEGIEKILDKSFMNCVNTTKISLPSTLKSVGKFAFYSCGKLEELI